jgi:hypothetical protein
MRDEASEKRNDYWTMTAVYATWRFNAGAFEMYSLLSAFTLFSSAKSSGIS